jgi:hypothetical protein
MSERGVASEGLQSGHVGPSVTNNLRYLESKFTEGEFSAGAPFTFTSM